MLLPDVGLKYMMFLGKRRVNSTSEKSVDSGQIANGCALATLSLVIFSLSPSRFILTVWLVIANIGYGQSAFD